MGEKTRESPGIPRQRLIVHSLTIRFGEELGKHHTSATKNPHQPENRLMRVGGRPNYYCLELEPGRQEEANEVNVSIVIARP